MPLHHDVMFRLTKRLKAMKPSDHGLKPLKSWAKINPYILYIVSLSYLYRKLIHNVYKLYAYYIYFTYIFW